MTHSASPTLLDYLERVPDFRRRQGRRYPLAKLLTMIIMAIMSGHYGYREIARFLKANEPKITEHLRLPRRRVPSHVTVRTVLTRVDFGALNQVFEAWATRHLQVQPGSWVAIDAKAIRSTVSDYDSAYQDFACLVSAFAHEQGVVMGMEAYRNKQVSEVAATRTLITQLCSVLGLKGVTFTLDALHCKKRPSS